MILIFDGQKWFLPIGSNNLFGIVTFISNGECYLFDAEVFHIFLLNRLNF